MAKHSWIYGTYGISMVLSCLGEVIHVAYWNLRAMEQDICNVVTFVTE